MGGKHAKEGKYTIGGTIIAMIALLITIVQILYPEDRKKLDGEWKMTSKITKSNFSKYEGMTVEWKMFICEKNNTIKGTAEKIKINDIELETSNRTGLEFEGHINDDEIVLNYIENGNQRKTSGIIIANLIDDKFSGSFSQTAADTKGEIVAEKIK